MSEILYTKKVPKMGRGVFANKDIEKGEIIEVSEGVILSPGDVEFTEKTILQYYIYQCEDSDAHSILAFGLGSLFNDSEGNSNAKFDASYYSSIVEFTATKDIKKDDQVFIDYGWEEEDGKDV